MRNVLVITLLACIGLLPCKAQTISSLQNRGDSLMRIGLFEDARQAYMSAELALGKQRVSRNRIRLLYDSLATCNHQLGNYDKAMGYYELALKQLPKGSLRTHGIVLSMSDVLIITGQYNSAIDLLSSGYADATGSATPPAEAVAKRLVNLASCYCRTGKNEKALALLDSVIAASPVSEFIGAAARQNKGYILYSEGKLREAESLLKQSIPYLANDAQRYQAQGNLALVESGLGNGDEALRLIDESIGWQKAHLGNSHIDVTISLRKRAEILSAIPSGHADAVAAFKDFFNAERQNIIANFSYMSEQQRQDFWNTQKNLVAECYAVGSDDPDFAYDVAVFSKTVLLQTNMNLGNIVRNKSNLKSVYDDIISLRHKKSVSGSDDGTIDREIATKERLLMSQLKVMRDFTSRLTVTRKDVARSILNDRDRAVEFIRYTDHDTVRYAAVMTGRAGAASFIPLMTENELNGWNLHGQRRFGTLQNALESDRASDKDNIYSDTLLAERIWKPILRNVPKGAKVYFSPEGLFHLLAIEYMYTGRLDCALYRLSSTRRLCETRPKTARKTMLLVGGVDYDHCPDISYEEYPDRSTSRVLAADHQPPAVGGKYSFLKGSQKEVDTIRTIVRGMTAATLLKGTQCDEDTLKQILGRYSIVHISTHGFSTFYKLAPPPLYMKDEQTEDLSLSRSGILLTGANQLALQRAQNAHHEDGVLSAMELSAVDLGHVDLAVLSACQTGLGRVTADGVAGMPRGLKKAGAGAVIVSLWKVDDSATQKLMSFFYQNLRSGMSNHAALAKAQQQLRATVETSKKTSSQFNPVTGATQSSVSVVKKSYDKPHLWAPFILIDGI